MTNALNVNAVLEQIDKLQTHYDVFKYLKSVAGKFEFEKFLVCELPKLGETIADNLIVSNWDQELVQAFDLHNIASDGAQWNKLRSTILPVNIAGDLSFEADCNQVPLEAQLLLKHGYNYNVFFPLVQPDGVRWVFGFCGIANDASYGSNTEYLHLVLIHLADKMRRFETNKTEQRATLSEREKDCLKWTASGKTSGEIASILELSEHTVNHYLMNATRKLQAVTRTQAVVNAMRIGMIQ